MESNDVQNDDQETTVVEEATESPTDSGFNSNESESPSSSRCSSFSEAGSAISDDFATITDDLDNLNLTDDDLESALKDDIDLVIIKDDDEKNSVTFGKTMTVTDVISRSVGEDLNADDYDLMIDGRVLPRTITLRDAGVTGGTKVRLVEREMQIFIRRVDGRTTTIQIRPSNTIMAIKEQFFHTDQVPVHQQRLLFQSNELENTRTVVSYNIRVGSTLEMVYRLRGGCLTGKF
ncbi:unnamed protein product [Chironomus riparius]|uniref:Ubiquitin-like domain-containing protein n=1 Tax=Chironomus riparius TaxID=315576 RepID=A0A9N9S3V8_9DIPT|nr:unnamed protein product [Chironomus riparius]